MQGGGWARRHKQASQPASQGGVGRPALASSSSRMIGFETLSSDGALAMGRFAPFSDGSAGGGSGIISAHRRSMMGGKAGAHVGSSLATLASDAAGGPRSPAGAGGGRAGGGGGGGAASWASSSAAPLPSASSGQLAGKKLRRPTGERAAERAGVDPAKLPAAKPAALPGGKAKPRPANTMPASASAPVLPALRERHRGGGGGGSVGDAGGGGKLTPAQFYTEPGGLPRFYDGPDKAGGASGMLLPTSGVIELHPHR